MGHNAAATTATTAKAMYLHHEHPRGLRQKHLGIDRRPIQHHEPCVQLLIDEYFIQSFHCDTTRILRLLQSIQNVFPGFPAHNAVPHELEPHRQGVQRRSDLMRYETNKIATHLQHILDDE